MLGTSKAKHDNKGFELYITTAPIPDLNEKITVFGRVIKGEEVVQVKNAAFIFAVHLLDANPIVFFCTLSHSSSPIFEGSTI